MHYIVGILVVAVGIWLVAFGLKVIRKLTKYEFENRTSGGVVIFPNFEASDSHAKKRFGSWILVIIGTFTIMAGAIIII